MENNFESVSGLNARIKGLIENDDSLRHVLVKGEISNYKRYQSGFFFDLKDDKSLISSILWSDNYLYLDFEPKEGDEVIAEGYVTVYAPRGRYSLVVKSMHLFGAGKALLALKALAKKLQEEGLFDESKKRPIPEYPEKIGIITARKSAAEADLLRNIARRWPLADIYLFPSLVQGKEAPKALVAAFKKAAEYPLDVLIIARGGGSSEDLSAFNDETLAREVAKRKMPVISAVGHEIDTTIIDLVCDLRVSTPTAAAERATPDINDVKQELAELDERMSSSLLEAIARLKEKTLSLSNRSFFKNPASLISEEKNAISTLSLRLDGAFSERLSFQKEQVSSLISAFKALDPTKVLSRGYSLLTDKSGSLIKSKKDIKSGDEITNMVKDGIIVSVVK